MKEESHDESLIHLFGFFLLYFHWFSQALKFSFLNAILFLQLGIFLLNDELYMVLILEMFEDL